MSYLIELVLLIRNLIGNKMSKLTDYQLELMRHTVSGPNRNWFGTDNKGKDVVEFDKIVKMGYATSTYAPVWSGDDIIYRLTKEGKAQL